MPQLYCQLASRPGPWLLGRTSAGLCTLQTACPLTVTYSGGSPTADTIAAGSAATVYGGSAATFDASADVWVVLTVPASGALQVVKEADLATVSGDWAGLARVVQHSTEPYQPQAYLGAGGLGSGPTSTIVATVSDTGARARDLYNGTGNDDPDVTYPGWKTVGFDDSAWAFAVAAYYSVDQAPYIPAGTTAIWTTYRDITPPQNNLFRATFVLPAGSITAASLTISADGKEDAYLNGTLVAQDTAYGTGPVTTVSVPAGLLLAGQRNVIAVEGKEIGGGTADDKTWVTWSLSVGYTGGSGVPAPGSPAEGDLLSYHNGAWTRLPAGTNGYELTMVSGDPAWTAQPADADYADPLTAKGDLLTRSASATVRLGVGSNGQVLTADSTQADGVAWATPAASGVTSVALAGPTGTTVSGSPVTGAGTLTLTWASQAQNAVLAGPTSGSGAPTFRSLVAADIPGLPTSALTSGQLAPARGGTGLDTSSVSDGQVLIGQSSDHTLGLATLTAGSGVTITNAGHSITIAASGGSGTVTSVTLTVPGFLSVSGSPITTSGTLALTLATQSAGTVFAGPASGSAAAPAFRALAASDLPAAAAAGGHIHAHGHFL